MHLEGRDDLAGDLVLDLEDVGELAVVALRPDVAAAAAIDQLGGNPHPISGLTDAAFEDVAYPEFAAHLSEV